MIRHYFPNLNGLRFIAAFMVFFHHMEMRLGLNGSDNIFGESGSIYILGKLGVVFFFVLSGFLITYLLFEEKAQNGRINYGSFLMRRVLRIWPLYYTLVLSSLFIFPNIDFLTNDGWFTGAEPSEYGWQRFLYLTILPNLSLQMFGTLLHAGHTWSIGTEEQFYLMWPLLVIVFGNKRILLMLSVIVAHVAAVLFFNDPICGIVPYNMYFQGFLQVFNIDCMAVGGLAAIVVHQYPGLLKKLQQKWLLWGVVILSVVMIAFDVRAGLFTYLMYSFPFAMIIMLFSTMEFKRSVLETKAMGYLGKISYGLYMYHPLMIFVTIKLMAEGLSGVPLIVVSYLLALALTIGVAGASYRFMEKPFLRLKGRFS